jgi:hypothetical protein
MGLNHTSVPCSHFASSQFALRILRRMTLAARHLLDQILSPSDCIPGRGRLGIQDGIRDSRKYDTRRNYKDHRTDFSDEFLFADSLRKDTGACRKVSKGQFKIRD